MLRVKLKRIANSVLMGLMGCTLVLHKKRTKLVQGNPKMTRQEVLGAQLDEAARGLFILIKHIDTISVVAGSLYDKVENMKELANMCVQSGKSKMLKEVVKEFNYHNTGFLEELENLACLCLRDINASRRSIMKEIMVPQQVAHEAIKISIKAKTLTPETMDSNDVIRDAMTYTESRHRKTATAAVVRLKR
ncbi:hypothetical protein NL676_027672 [Syzygium grande]|nr:hypothetical protein NL676_027672 [Syzygium grande]